MIIKRKNINISSKKLITDIRNVLHRPKNILWIKYTEPLSAHHYEFKEKDINLVDLSVISYMRERTTGTEGGGVENCIL